MRAHESKLDSAESLAGLTGGRGPLYALLDAARDPAVLEHLQSSGELFESLYAGRRAGQLAAVAPYLAQVSVGAPLFDALARHGWGESWGVLLAARSPFAEVRRHLRRFLTVETEAGEALSFRFYDPRVLRVFLASATDDERRAFFGPITAFFVEAPAPGTLLCFERVGAALPAPEPPWDLPRIRDAQCAAFSRALEDDFVDRAARRLQGALRPWARDDVEARAILVDALARAARRGIETTGDVERYFDLVGALGPAFDERLPWARTILAREELTAEHKLNRLERAKRLRRPRGGSPA